MFKFRVVNCVRCSGEHPELEFNDLKRGDAGWDCWAVCPTTSEPIMLKVGGGHHAHVQPKMQPIEKGVTVLPVEKCPRCGGNHGNLSFTKMLNETKQVDHFSVCPVTQQPILACIMSVTTEANP